MAIISSMKAFTSYARIRWEIAYAGCMTKMIPTRDEASFVRGEAERTFKRTPDGNATSSRDQESAKTPPCRLLDDTVCGRSLASRPVTCAISRSTLGNSLTGSLKAHTECQNPQAKNQCQVHHCNCEKSLLADKKRRTIQKYVAFIFLWDNKMCGAISTCIVFGVFRVKRKFRVKLLIVLSFQRN